ncbi:hypothetical protein A1O3_00840 [Capronia epimyces CBS 606.96]|uniref:Uncharacterized protein n=1 Tax=Capronia epimyces CBS 606.96 TaxID=1182542 RepID=W9YRH8_9EURO|nr:uncharacterized protein A1O3_00840 [Capronia epimyces CBS 606.96]EXJ92290.1 hypothetical protein A1O3_00840 [Capronia epimyces CBS 606.96]
MSSTQGTTSSSGATQSLSSNTSSILLPDLPFQLCFILLVTIVGPLYLAVLIVGSFFVLLLDKLYHGIQDVWPRGTYVVGDMNSDTNHVRRPRQVSCSDNEATKDLSPSALADFDFDLGSGASNLDSKQEVNVLSANTPLESLGMTRTTPDTSSSQPTQCLVAVAQDNESEFGCLLDHDQDQEKLAVPQTSDGKQGAVDGHGLRWADRPSGCPIYSKEWRRQVRKAGIWGSQPEHTDSVENANDIQKLDSIASSEISSKEFADDNSRRRHGQHEPPSPQSCLPTTCLPHKQETANATMMEGSTMLARQKEKCTERKAKKKKKKKFARIRAWILKYRRSAEKISPVSPENISHSAATSTATRLRGGGKKISNMRGRVLLSSSIYMAEPEILTDIKIRRGAHISKTPNRPR